MIINDNKLKNIMIVLLFIFLGLLSFVVVTRYSTNEEVHKQSVEQIDEEIGTVLKLTAGATGASAAISLLPDDQCTPIAEQFAELGKYFMIVLSALYMEKYLITMLGYVSFSFLIPLACVIVIIGYLSKQGKFIEFAFKLAIAALAIYLVIPVSVRTSEVIYHNYENTISETLESVDRISVEDTDENGMEKFLSWIENAAGTIVDYVTGLLSRFLEAIAVMLVTSCLIPILVIMFFTWMIKTLFNTSFSMSDVDNMLKVLHLQNKL